MTASEILDQLETSAVHYHFPLLDNGYIYPADVRLNVYRDTQNWLMIIETLGVNNPRTSGYDSFCNCLSIFGSQLHLRPPGPANEDFLYPIDECPDDPLFEDEFEWFAKDDARCVMIRGQRIQLNLSPAALTAKGIVPIEPPRIDPVMILRSLLPEYRSQLLASEEELAQRNPLHLPLWLRLDEWCHPNLEALAQEGGVGGCETFQMLAEAISSGDKTIYRPTDPPNTHWQNWPEGGTL
jgi:uncharacterized protein DUF7003